MEDVIMQVILYLIGALASIIGSIIVAKLPTIFKKIEAKWNIDIDIYNFCTIDTTWKQR